MSGTVNILEKYIGINRLLIEIVVEYGSQKQAWCENPERHVEETGERTIEKRST
jgi:hypothetical protein